MSQTEVTQAAFRRIMAYNPSVFDGDNLPVESVTWVEADAYCTAIGGRLPSAAEWEYAARAGTTGSRYGNLDDIAWYWNNAKFATHPVGKKKPNAFGLYDMLGNVVEWTYTWYWVQLNQENINPTGPSTAEYKELRGGGWWDDPELVRASYRRRFETTDEDYNIGFRCASEYRSTVLIPSAFIRVYRRLILDSYLASACVVTTGPMPTISRTQSPSLAPS